jgi:hypothetical protein
MKIDLIEVVRRLTGPILPVGETHEDAARLGNLESVIHLVDRLICDLEDAAVNADRREASMRAIGQRAQSYLKGLRREEP